jgi:hypothetical protein
MTIIHRAARALALLVLGFGVGQATAQAANLVKNGSFEKPVVPDASFEKFFSGDNISGWTVAGSPGNVDLINGDYCLAAKSFDCPAKAGTQWLDLTGTSFSETGVQQAVATAAGQSYKLTFHVGNIYDKGGKFGTTSTVKLLVDGVQVLEATNKRGKGTTTIDWKKFAFTFVAASSSTTIAFLNGDPPDDDANGLDLVKLVPVP